MTTIQTIIRQVNKDLVPQFEERLRGFLITQDKDWLIDQIIRLALDAHSLQEMDRKQLQEVKAKARADRIVRLHEMDLNLQTLAVFLERYGSYDRAKLIAEGYLLASAPPKGGDLIGEEHRTEKGQVLLQHAKDILFGLLFGDESTQTQFERVQRELLTFALPRFKAEALDFMKASTEMSAAGTWQDPDSVSNDARADNVIMAVEYGEIVGEAIGHGIVRGLSLINNLEVNQQILYARMINIEQSTLIE
ncbi:MAG: hypothetical protein WA029_12485 [Anaerolineae bacterium]